MANKPRVGSDPFQKKDPLGWIAGDQGEATGKPKGVQGLPSKPEQPSKPDKPGTQGGPSKAGNPSKQRLPSPPSSPDHPGTLSKPPRGSTTAKGLHPGWTRATFIVREEAVKKLRALAYWERKELKAVINEAFWNYLQGKDVPEIPDHAE